MAAIGGAVDAVVVPVVVPVSLVALAPIIVCRVVYLSLCRVVSMMLTHGPRPYLRGSHVMGLGMPRPSSLSPPTFHLSPRHRGAPLHIVPMLPTSTP